MDIRTTGIALVLATVASVASGLTYPIVDTGQDSCYDTLHTIAPPAPGEQFYGQDAQFAGNQPSYRDNGDSTVSDLVTGLMWVKARGEKMSWYDAVNGAAACRVDGYGDWRMPTIKELYSLIDFRGFSGVSAYDARPYIDTTFFEFRYGDTLAGERYIDCQDWSATLYIGTVMAGDSGVFGVNFADGRIKGYPTTRPQPPPSPNPLYVRYVRGNPEYGVNVFADNGDGTVTDSATGLSWSKQNSDSAMSWQQALAWTQARNAENWLGHDDWRLPNAKELQSIVDYARSPGARNPADRGPAIDTAYFGITPIINERAELDYPWCWTSTTHCDGPADMRFTQAVYVTFGRASGWMMLPGNSYYSFLDVHGAGAQRSDPKRGNPRDYYLGLDSLGDSVFGRGPQGDCVRIENYVRLVRDAEAGVEENRGSRTGTQVGPSIAAASPFRGRTVVRYVLPKAGPVRLVVLDPAGRAVRTLAEGTRQAGSYEAVWDGTDSDCRPGAPGVYFVRADAGGQTATQKLVMQD